MGTTTEVVSIKHQQKQTRFQQGGKKKWKETFSTQNSKPKGEKECVCWGSGKEVEISRKVSKT